MVIAVATLYPWVTEAANDRFGPQSLGSTAKQLSLRLTQKSLVTSKNAPTQEGGPCQLPASSHER